MTRVIAIAAALATSASLFGASTVEARPAGAYYSATPVAAPKNVNIVTRNTVWACNGGVCTASRSGSRPTIICQLAVSRLGALSAFSIDGSPVAEATLAECNKRAK
jgi:hypothetical protein